MNSSSARQLPSVSGASQPSQVVSSEGGHIVDMQVSESVLDESQALAAKELGLPVNRQRENASRPPSHPTIAKSLTMNTEPLPDVRGVVRLVQCQQCSLPLRSPITLPCGHSLCPPCLPERHKRENISYPLSSARLEGFICPFSDCGQEHSVADCSQDVTLTKVMEAVALQMACHRPLHPDSPTLLEEKIRARTEAELAQMQISGAGMPLERSRVLTGGSLASAYMMAEIGELRYDSDVVFRPQNIVGATYNGLDNLLFDLMQAAVRQEFDCQLCWNLLHEPFTTPCGHTFCRGCVARTLDHSDTCPVCRKVLQLPPGVKNESGNRRLQKMTERFWPDELKARVDAIDAEKEASKNDIPIFVVTLSYPGMPTFLHVFEPRYRLMMRRVMDTESRIFGMTMYNGRRIPQGDDLGPHCTFMRQGTLLQIVNMAMLPDGRSLIEAVGVGRFSTRNWWEQDGYIVARTERIEDVGLEQEERIEAEEVQRAPVPDISSAYARDPLIELDSMPTAELLHIVADFVTRMRQASAPWLNERILESFGQPPLDNPRMFPYWFASVLPISEEEKYALLGTTSVRQRLKMTAKWVRRIEAQRWFSVSSCNVA